MTTAHDSNVGTLEDVSGLRRKVQHLLHEIRTLKDENIALKASNEQIRIEAGVAPREAETAIERFCRLHADRLKGLEPGSPEYQAEIDKILDEPDAVALRETEVQAHRKQGEERLAKLRSDVEKIGRKSAAMRITKALARDGALELLLPQIEQRVSGKWVNEEFVTEILDADGRPSTEEALLTEFRERRPDLATVVRGASAEDKARRARLVAEMMMGTAPQSTVQLTRAQFEALEPQARGAAIAAGTKIVEH